MVNNEDFINYASYHNISDFSNLSLREIITMQFLVRYKEPIVRHLLYTEVKQFIEFKENVPERKDLTKSPDYEKKFFDFIRKNKQLHPPSFYNMLNNLEEIGLIQYEETESGKIPNIKETPYTNFIPQLLLKFLINNNILVSEEYRKEFSKKFLEKLVENGKFDFIISIWFSEYVMIPIIKLLSEYSNEQYILPKDGSNENLKGLNINNTKFTEIISVKDEFNEIKKKISTPKNIFDAVIIPVYKKNPKFYNLNRNQILKESSRVIKPKGKIILVSVAEIPFTENIFLNELIKLYNISLNNRIFSRRELETDLIKAGFIDVEIFEHQGLLIGIGRKKSIDLSSF